MNKEFLLFTIWIISAVGTAGSLFFSEVMLYPPCTLCWYQRICLYPLAIIIIPALIHFDRSVIKYTLPLVVAGTCISIYHNLIYFGLIDESLSPCRMGISCKAVFLNWFGFIDIPQLSLMTFILILTLILFLKKEVKNEI